MAGVPGSSDARFSPCHPYPRSSATLWEDASESFHHLPASSMKAFVGCPKEFEDLVIARLSPPLQALVERVGLAWRQSKELATPFVQHKAHGTG